MSDRKPRELFLVGSNNCEGPILCVVNSKESAEDCVSMIKRSNNPTYIHVIEKNAYDRCKEVALDAITRCNNIVKERDQLRADLDLAIEALKRLSEVSKSPGHPSFNDMEIVGKFVDETLAKLQENKP